MATRSSRRSASKAAPGKTGRATEPRPAPQKTASGAMEEIVARAARLGITVERVLAEYRDIAFADLRHILEWGPDGVRIKASGDMQPEDAAAIREIMPGSDPEHSRVKLYDRKAALDAIARHLGMFPTAPRRPEAGASQKEEEGDDPREFLIREIARLAAAAGEEPADPDAEPEAGTATDP